jgi:hypothetical protein
MTGRTLVSIAERQPIGRVFDVVAGQKGYQVKGNEAPANAARTIIVALAGRGGESTIFDLPLPDSTDTRALCCG